MVSQAGTETRDVRRKDVVAEVLQKNKPVETLTLHKGAKIICHIIDTGDRGSSNCYVLAQSPVPHSKAVIRIPLRYMLNAQNAPKPPSSAQ